MCLVFLIVLLIIIGIVLSVVYMDKGSPSPPPNPLIAGEDNGLVSSASCLPLCPCHPPETIHCLPRGVSPAPSQPPPPFPVLPLVGSCTKHPQLHCPAAEMRFPVSALKDPDPLW